MFYIIRCVVCFVLIMITFITVRQKPHKILRLVVSLGMVVLIFYCSVCFPIEQVHKFNTPQEVFEYMYIGNIDFVEYGKDTAYIAYRNPNKQSVCKSAIIKKEGSKYVVKVVRKIDVLYSFLDDGCSVKIYSIKDSDDYYVTIFGIFDQSLIFDSDNNAFQFSSVNDVGFTTVYIRNIDNYQLNVQTANKQQLIKVERSDDGHLDFFTKSESQQSGDG